MTLAPTTGDSDGVAAVTGVSEAISAPQLWKPPTQNLRSLARTANSAWETQRLNSQYYMSVGTQSDLNELKRVLHCTATVVGTVLELVTPFDLAQAPEGLEVSFYLTGTNTGALTATLDGVNLGVVETVLDTALPAGYILSGKLTRGWWTGTKLVLGRLPEYGTDVNGEWARYENGEQECRHSLTSSAAGLVTWTLPKPFLNTAYSPTFSCNSITATGFIPRYTGKLTTQFDFDVRQLDTGALIAVATDMTAKGRWY